MTSAFIRFQAMASILAPPMYLAMVICLHYKASKAMPTLTHP
jgi:hypothetical protein